ncbi:MAG: fumarylacetoacetate hydrolase family protein [Candidatus Binatia bacterium]
MGRTIMATLLTTLLSACSASWEPAFDESIAEGEERTVAITDPDVALTFARIRTPGGLHLLAVTSWQDDRIEAVDLSASLSLADSDPVSLFLERGYNRLRDDVVGAPDAARISIAAADLVLPLDFGGHHIAVGTNYAEHADDAGTTRPFLFPKMVEPTPWTGEVSTGGGLLDYEVELALVPLEPLAPGQSPRHLGLILSNDFTDRETLVRALDPDDVESGKGFTPGKSFPGFLPVGSLLVVPRDYRAFAASLELRLFVGDRLRQRALVSEMVWNVDEVISQVLARKGVRWDHRGQQVALFEGEAIPARTLVLTGTPHGTVFDGIPARAMASGVLRWLAGGWDRSVADRVLEAYVGMARDAKAYLQPGDEVLLHVHRLGQVRSRVVP